MKRIKRVLVLLFVLVMSCLSGSCAKADNEEPKKAAIKDFEALNEVKDGRVNVYLIVKALGNNYWDTMTDYVKKSADTLDCNVYFSGSENENEWEDQVTLLDMAVEAGADVIIIAPDHSSNLAEPISRIHKMGIPVVLLDTTITVDDYDVCCMTDNLYAGQQAAMEMISELSEMGYTESDSLKVGIGVGSATSQTISERLAGFSQYWTGHAPDTWTIITDIKVNGGDADRAEECAYELMNEYPDMRGVFGCNNGSTVGFAKAISKNNRTDIAIVGFDYSDDIAGLISQPEYYAATMLQRQYDMAYYSVKAAINLVEGNPVGDKFVDTGVLVVNKKTIYTEDVKAILSLD